MFEKFSVKKPFTVLVAVIVVIALGVVSLTKMTTDLLPPMSIPTLMVIVPYPGASPEKVESEVSGPMESALGTVKNVKEVTSTSAENYTIVQLSFANGTNMDSAMVNVSSTVNQVAAGLPSGCGTPTILELSMDMIATLYLAVSLDDADIFELSEYVEDEVVPHFQRLDGVASVTTVGTVEQYVQVDLNGEKIDVLNDKILASTNEALDAAQKQLDAARRQIAAGQAALQAQEKNFGTSLSEMLFAQIDDPTENALSSLDTGSEDLLDLLEKLKTAIMTPAVYFDGLVKDAERDVAGLDAALADAQVVYENARQTERDALAVWTSAQTALQSAGEARQDLQDAATAAQSALANARLALSLAASDLDAARAAYDDAQNDLQEVYDEMTSAAAIVADAASSAAIGTKIDTFISSVRRLRTSSRSASLGELIPALQDFRDLPLETRTFLGSIDIMPAAKSAVKLLNDIESRIKDLSSEASAGLPGVMDALQVVLAQLAQGQLDAALGFAEAARQLADAESQLGEALLQFASAREKALASANVDSLVSASTLSQLIYAENFAMPAGYIDDADDNSWLLRVGDEYASPDDIAGALLADLGEIGVVRLSDVADVTVIDNVGMSYARLNAGDGIMLCIYKSSTSGTNEVSTNCVAAAKELMAADSRVHLVELVNQGEYIDIIIASILQSMAIGAILAVLVLALFLRDVRPTIMVALSIPLSVLFALVLMYFTGYTLNMMTLSGLALGIGMLVDNSIVVIENVMRLRHRGVEPARAAVQGTRQVVGSIIASTLTTICVFFPMVFTSGTVRQLLVPLAMSVSYCLVASLLVAVTVIPASSSTILKRSEPKKNAVMERVQGAYAKALSWCLSHKAVPLLVSASLLAVCVLRVFSMGITVLPEMTAGSIQVEIYTRAGDDRQTSYRKVDQVMEALMTVDGINDIGIMDYGSVISSVGVMSGMSGSSYGDYLCFAVVPENIGKAKAHAIVDEIERVTADIDCDVYASIGGMMDFTSFVSSGLTVNVYGRRMDELQKIAEQVASAARGIEGFVNVSAGAELTTQTLHLVIDKDKAMACGLTVAQIYMQIAERLQTEVNSTQITTNGTDMNVVVRNHTNPLTRENLLDMEFKGGSLGASMGSGLGSSGIPAGLGVSGMPAGLGPSELSLPGESDAQTLPGDEQADPDVHKLSEFATVEEAMSASSIRHENLNRYVTVTAGTAEGYTTTLLARELRTKIAEIEKTLPRGYSIEIAGEAVQVDEMVSQMIGLVALGLLFVYLVMVAEFQSLLSPFIILFTIPLAFTGGMLALIFSGQRITMMSLMGFLILMGTVVNNGIVFVDFVNQLRIGGMEKRAALVATGQTRMRPILMTTLTTILAMVFLLFGKDMGSQLGSGIALVMVGGLLYAMLMTLFIVPVMYDILYRRTPKNIDVGADLDDSFDDAAEFLASRGQENA